MDADRNIFIPDNSFFDGSYQTCVFGRQRVTDCVRNIQNRGTGICRYTENLAQEIDIASRGVLRRKFDIIRCLAGDPDGVCGHLQNLITSLL